MLEKQIEKYKTKLAKRIKSGSFKSELVASSAVEEESDSVKVVKTKRFSVRPMFVEEAVLQMNMINHDFFVFRQLGEKFEPEQGVFFWNLHGISSC